MRQNLNQFLADLKSLRNDIKSDSSKTVNRNAVRKRAEDLATSWLSTNSNQLLSTEQISKDILKKYSDLFRQLLKITSPSNLRVSYLKLLNSIIKSFRSDIILVLHEQPPTSASLTLLTTLFKGLPSDENTYLNESIGCALKGFLRASVVLGWCAAITYGKSAKGKV